MTTPIPQALADLSRQVQELKAENVRLREIERLAALVEARESVNRWATFADICSREKHDLAGDLAKIDAVIERNSK